MPPFDFRHYVPILKGRLGEFTALSESEIDPNSFTPLLEVVPGSVDYTDDGEPELETVIQDLDRFVGRVQSKWQNRPMIVDGGLVPGPDDVVPVVELIRRLGYTGGLVRPVVRPSDNPDVLRAVGEVVQQYQVGSACIRIAGEDLDDTEQPLRSSIDSVLGYLQLAPADVDVVLDLGEVNTEQAASFGARIIRLTLSELPYADDWRILAMAGGAFPTDLNAVQPGLLAPIPRLDAEAWRAVRGRFSGRMPSFADYAIAHPVMPATAGFAPAPQIRYTVSSDWFVMKGRKGERRGTAQFFDICRSITELSEFTRDLSWGDRRIAVVLDGRTDDELRKSPGTGNAMTWRAIGTSHHMALVVNRLATLGEP